VSVGNVGVGQAGVVAIQLAVGIGNRAEQIPSVLGQPELYTIVFTNGLGLNRALGAKRGSKPVCLKHTMEQVAVAGARVANIETQRVRYADVLNHLIETLARVAGLEEERRVDRPVRAKYVLTLLHGFDLRINARILGIDYVQPEVLVFYE